MSLGLFGVCLIAMGFACTAAQAQEATITASGNPVEGPLDQFPGPAKFEMRQLFTGERFPNVVVATNGTVVATWGGISRDNEGSIRVRRSEDGGETWGPEITVAEPGFHGGGATVDENTGDILVFLQVGHPPSGIHMYRSKDSGKTWNHEETTILPDAQGNVPSLHMSEHGITLSHGKHAGRLLRPARVYGRPDGYNTAVYSDDGGKTWHPSGPFPDMGTGEGAVAELSNGTIYYSSRRHWFENEADFTSDRPFAWSHDGGETWRDLGTSDVLPDGPRYRGTERRGSNYNGHFGMMAGLVRLPVEDQDILLYSNADTDTHVRERITVWASFDGGKSWPVKRLVHEGPGAYSSLAAGRPGTPSEGWIYIEFEGGGKERYEGAQLARFTLAWLLEGKDISEFLPDAKQAGNSQNAELGFHNPTVVEGDASSIVEKVESAVIIPGDTHEDLWVHPELVTIPGDPIVAELRARTTDRFGKDQHTTRHYFQTSDSFESLHPIEKPEADAWKRIGLAPRHLDTSAPDAIDAPESLGHTWASAYVWLDADTILQAFTTRDGNRYLVQSLVAKVKNGKLVPVHVSNSWTIDTGRGLYEPQIAVYQGRCYMTVRAEDGHGYVLVSNDGGRSWQEPVPWTWDNGEPIPMNQTMTKLLAHSEGLVLVYTRIRDDNGDVFRNRAPLHCADVDTNTLSLKRATERIIVPEKGLPVGNFWVWPVSQHASYVVTAEWPRDGRQANGDTWLAKITWRQPNALLSSDGRERKDGSSKQG